MGVEAHLVVGANKDRMHTRRAAGTDIIYKTTNLSYSVARSSAALVLHSEQLFIFPAFMAPSAA